MQVYNATVIVECMPLRHQLETSIFSMYLLSFRLHQTQRSLDRLRVHWIGALALALQESWTIFPCLGQTFRMPRLGHRTICWSSHRRGKCDHGMQQLLPSSVVPGLVWCSASCLTTETTPERSHTRMDERTHVCHVFLTKIIKVGKRMMYAVSIL